MNVKMEIISINVNESQQVISSELIKTDESGCNIYRRDVLADGTIVWDIINCDGECDEEELETKYQSLRPNKTLSIKEFMFNNLMEMNERFNNMGIKKEQIISISKQFILNKYVYFVFINN